MNKKLDLNDIFSIIGTEEAANTAIDNIIKNIELISKHFSETIFAQMQMLYQQTPEISEERKKELESFCKKMLEYGWVIFDYLPMNIYQQNFETKEEATIYVKRYCNEKYLNKIFKSLLDNGLSLEDVENIKISYNCKAYKACSSLIVSVVEHYVVCEYKINANPILKDGAIKGIEELNSNKNGNKILLFSYLHNYSLCLGLREVFKDINPINNSDDSAFCVPNRHCLSHGYSKRNYTEDDCLFLILLLFGLVSQKDKIINSEKPYIK